METFDKQKYTSFLVKGKLHDAIKYLESLQDQDDLLNKYESVFVENKEVLRSSNKVINEIDRIYQNYYKDVFWNEVSIEIAENKLFYNLWKFCGEGSSLEKNSTIEIEVEKIVRKEGFEFLGGYTSGFLGPYIWETSNKVTYDVELPSGNEQYSIILMEGFVSRSWLDFLSFGKVGTGGWSGKDGMLYCVKSIYDTDSPIFKISFLKHEAQHSLDKKMFPNITSNELEYRAKLVELAYWEDEKLIKMIHFESDNSDEKNSHSIASHRVLSDISRKLFFFDYVHDFELFLDKISDIKTVAQELLIEDTKRLSTYNTLLKSKKEGESKGDKSIWKTSNHQ